MTQNLDLGFVALTDAAPLIVAREHGFFEEEGLRVTLRREVSWATIRDKVAAGLYQGAHMLAPAVLAANLGVGSEPAQVLAPMALAANSASIGVSRRLAALMEELSPNAPTSAVALLRAAEARAAARAPALCFAVVFPFSMHNYLLRHWLAAAGVDPDKDLRIVVAPPTAIAARLRSGEIDGFCVGAPWADVCEAESGASILLEAGDYWPGGPDKVLGLSQAWAARAPEGVLALTRATLRGAVWANDPGNADVLASLLARADLVHAPAPLIARRLENIRFGAPPQQTHAAWLLAQMLRWRQLDPGADLTAALSAYRADMFADAASSPSLVAFTAAAPMGEEACSPDADAIRERAIQYAIARG